MIILVARKGIQCAVNSVILTGFNLNRNPYFGYYPVKY